MKNILLIALSLMISVGLTAQQSSEPENIFIITTDGFRWQEVFNGADSAIINNTKFVKDTALIKQMFWSVSKEERRQRLMPFFWNIIAGKGQLYGNRQYDNKVAVKNFWRISYPGYSELMTGYADPVPILNKPRYNSNESILAYLNRQEPFAGKVAAFSSWNLFPYILDVKHNKQFLNSGYQEIEGDSSETCLLINQVQRQMQDRGHCRYDLLTFLHAKEYIQNHHPKVVFLSFGETDEFAHKKQYDNYLQSAKTFDRLIEELWYYIQTDVFYKNKTTLIITTDHGRGEKTGKWNTHDFLTKGSGQTWLALLGRGIIPQGEMKSAGQIYQNQIAATIAQLLGVKFISKRTVGREILLPKPVLLKTSSVTASSSGGLKKSF